MTLKKHRKEDLLNFVLNHTRAYLKSKINFRFFAHLLDMTGHLLDVTGDLLDVTGYSHVTGLSNVTSFSHGRDTCHSHGRSVTTGDESRAKRQILFVISNESSQHAHRRRGS
jgi:hypothetical protein